MILFANRRRQLLALTAATCVAAARGADAQAALKRLLMLDFELVDSQDSPFPERDARLGMITSRLREAFIRERFYEVVDPAPVREMIRAAKAVHELTDCNGCELDIARAAGADRVLVGWVQRVSNLILNINIEVRAVDSGDVVLAKSVDLRGNTDLSWQRGIDYMVRGMLDKDQRNR